MKDTELKQLKDKLWHSADVLRAGAHLAANKYGQPILGLIFLRYADILYKQHKDEIEAEYNRLKGSRMEKSMKEISLEKCGFYLPECAYYDFINDAPDDANKAIIVKEAMEIIEWRVSFLKKYMRSWFRKRNQSFFLTLYVFSRIFLKTALLTSLVKFMNIS